MMTTVFVFNGAKAQLPSAVFTEYALAEQWIHLHKLSGLLTAYPLNKGVYEWAIESDNFEPTKDYQKTSAFIQKFTHAALEHYHFEDGVLQ